MACTTGTSGQDIRYCTVGGGEDNAASGLYATVGGGEYNTASGYYATVGGGWHNAAVANATVGGGYRNTASGFHATVGGGWINTASGATATVGGGANNTASGGDNGATVGGGGSNTASGYAATVPGGYADTAAGDYSFAGGYNVKITEDADYTFAFGNNFTTSTPHAVIFHDTDTPIKVGIGTTTPDSKLDVEGSSTEALLTITNTSTSSGSDEPRLIDGAFNWGSSGDSYRFYVGTLGSWGALRMQRTDPGDSCEIALMSYGAGINYIKSRAGAGFSDGAAIHVNGGDNDAIPYIYFSVDETYIGEPGSNPRDGIGNLYVKGNLGIGTTSPQRALHISDVMRLEPRDSAPDNPAEGDIYVNSADHHIYCYLNGVWKQLDN
jgi:hypothetical protein